MRLLFSTPIARIHHLIELDVLRIESMGLAITSKWNAISEIECYFYFSLSKLVFIFMNVRFLEKQILTGLDFYWSIHAKLQLVHDMLVMNFWLYV